MGLHFSVIVKNWDYFLWGRTFQGEVGGLWLTILMATAAGILSMILGISGGRGCVARSPAPTESAQGLGGLRPRDSPDLRDLLDLFPRSRLARRRNSRDLFGRRRLSLVQLGRGHVHDAGRPGRSALGASGSGDRKRLDRRTGPGLDPLAAEPPESPCLPTWPLFASMIKDTSLAYILNVPELTMTANQVNTRAQIYPAEIFLFTAAVYFVLCSLLSWGAHFAHQISSLVFSRSLMSPYAHALVHGLAHIVDRQGGHGDSRQRLHLYSRLVRADRARLDIDAVPRGARAKARPVRSRCCGTRV